MKLEWNWTDLVAVLVAGIVCALLISGCGAESGEPEPVTEPRELQRSEQMEYVNFDGHEYVRYVYLRGSNCSIGGITHSPKCPCMVNEYDIHL